MEVMGLLLGEYIDEWTTQVVDVFAMPQSGTSVTVESVDHVFQTNMVEMLKQTGRYIVALFPYCWSRLLTVTLDPKWSLGGTIPILDLDAGCRALTSKLNK